MSELTNPPSRHNHRRLDRPTSVKSLTIGTLSSRRCGKGSEDCVRLTFKAGPGGAVDQHRRRWHIISKGFSGASGRRQSFCVANTAEQASSVLPRTGDIINLSGVLRDAGTRVLS